MTDLTQIKTDISTLMTAEITFLRGTEEKIGEGT
jgi:hypothetical protein